MKYLQSVLIAATVVASLWLLAGVGYAANSIPTGPDSAETTGDSVNLTLNPTAMTVRGCSAPYSLVTIFRNNLPAGTVVSEGNGDFSKYLLLDYVGLHNVKVYGEDQFGLQTSTITRNVSAQPHFNVLVDVTLPPTAKINKSIYAAGQQITFLGSTCPKTDLNLIIDNNISLNVKSNSNGEWFAVISSLGFSFGEHSFHVTKTDAKGSLVSSQKQLFRIVKSLDDEGQDESLAPGDLEPPIIDSPEDNYLSSTPNITLTGTAQPNVQVEILRDGQIIGSVFSNPLGEWSFSFVMVDNQHSLLARACVSYGCSDVSNEVTIFYQGVLGHCSFEFRFAKYRFFRHSARRGLDLELLKADSEPPYELIIDWGDDSVDTTRLAENRSIKYHHVYDFVGNYNGIVTLQDSLGCLQTHYFAVEVVEGKTALAWFLLLIASGYVFALARSQRVNEFAAKKRRKRRK